MVAVPTLFPITLPALDTLATVLSEDDHETDAPFAPVTVRVVA